MNLNKINNDPFYKDLLSTLGYNGIEEAGFFEDNRKGEKIDYAINILCTPLVSLISNLHKIEKGFKPCVLLTSGSFCPIHFGHLEILTNSKAYLKTLGYEVINAYISAGHDEYITHKNKDKAILIHERLSLIQDLIKKEGLNEWVSIDPWEGVFNKYAINFTEVIERLSLYIKKHTQIDIPIFFVCGGDNARFSLTFMQKGNCIVVNRPNYEDRFKNFKLRLESYSDRIIFIEGKNESSSTKIRADLKYDSFKKKDLKLRIEKYNKVVYEALHIFSDYFNNIELVMLEEQIEQINNKDKKYEFISIDPLIPLSHNISISRLYDNFGINKIGYTNRPKTEKLEVQIKNIPKNNDYIIFDDDINSGGTIDFAKELFKNHKIKGVFTLNSNLNNVEKIEILDVRDFLLSNELGGLVIKFPNDILTRVPYIYPFVCPFNRASINKPFEFSIRIWELNLNYFKDSNLKLKDYEHLDIFRYMGYGEDVLISHICENIISFLKQSYEK